MKYLCPLPCYYPSKTQYMERAEQKIDDDLRASVAYRDAVTREEGRLIQLQGRSTKQWREELGEQLMSRVAKRARSDIVTIMRKEAMRNNLRRPWDGKHGTLFKFALFGSCLALFGFCLALFGSCLALFGSCLALFGSCLWVPNLICLFL
jgi:hypothetical protein